MEDYTDTLKETWKLSRVPWMYMWTNRFPVEAFEWYEDLIQDPRKIKSETMWEWVWHFEKFVLDGKKLDCFWERCEVCFIKQYCDLAIKSHKKDKTDKYKNSLIINDKNIDEINNFTWDYLILRWEEFPSKVYSKFWDNAEKFKSYIRGIKLNKGQELVNVPICIREDNNNWKYEYYEDIKEEDTLKDYTFKYIKNLYRKKSLRCKECKYYNSCEWIHINFIRSYGFKILEPIKN